MARQWTPEEVLETARAYQRACMLAAAVDLDVFSVLGDGWTTASSLAAELGTDRRATTILLDALVAMELLAKQDDEYSVPPEVAETLTESGSRSVLPMVRHQGNCLRRWVQLAQTVRTGKRPEGPASIRGEAADQAAFIGAMHNVSRPAAEHLIDELRPLAFRRLLDVGGASGTWTIEFLRAVPGATATLFDLPAVIPLARARITEAGLSERVTLVPGDFYVDDLPGGADFAWVSAIGHQNSREQNEALFVKIRRALTADGVLLLRDLVMDASRTRPAAGAMFAVNMLTATEGGGTYTFDEYREDLMAGGFADVRFLRRDEWMNSVIRAVKGGPSQ